MLSTHFPNGSSQEVLGGATIRIDASTLSLTHYTANGDGLTLSNGAVLTIGNAGKNHYGAFLGNGPGGIKVTSGTAFVNLYADLTAVEKELSWATLRDGGYKITVSQGAELEWLGGIRAHVSTFADAKVVVDGAGTLKLKGGEIGGRYNGSTVSAGELAISGGGTVIFDGAAVYADSRITVSGTGTTLNAAKQAAFAGSSDITVNQGAKLTIGVQDGLQNSGKIILHGGMLDLAHYTTISNGMELNGVTVNNTGNYGNSSYGSFLFNSPLTVTGGTAAAPSTSTMSVVGARFRGQNSTIDVAEYTTLRYSGNVSYDNSGTQTDLIKTGKGTWNVASGTFGMYYADAWGSAVSGGSIRVEEGTLALNGAKFQSGSTVMVTPESDASATLEVRTGTVGSRITYQIIGTAGLTTPNAILSVTGNDALFENRGKIELTNGLLTASQYTTIDSQTMLKNGQIISTATNPHANYGSFLFNGIHLTEGQYVVNAMEGTSLIRAGGIGIRLRTNDGTSTVAVAKRSTAWNVADGAVLNVEASVTYDNTLTNADENARHGIYKTGGGLWDQKTGTLGGFTSSTGGRVNAAGKVFVEDGTLRMSGDSRFYENSHVYVMSGGTLDLNTSATFSTVYHLAGSGANGVGALLFSNDRAITNSIYLDAATSIGVAEGVTATISTAIPSSQALTKVGLGTLILDAADNKVTSLEILEGTLKLEKYFTIKNGTKSITVSGTDAVLELAANDAIAFGNDAAGENGIVIKNGGTLISTAENTHVTLTHGFTLENGTVAAVGKGNETSGNASHGLGIGYGNYLLVDEVKVSGTGVSTIDAYRIRIRSGADGGVFTIAPNAVLEMNSRLDTDQGRGMTVCGGGTLRPTAVSFTTPGLAIQNSTLDLTALDDPTTGTDWQLLSMTGENASLGMVDIVQTMAGSSRSSGLFSMDSGSWLVVDLQMAEDGILGQTILADGFDIHDATLELNLLGDWTLEAVGSYPLFSEDLLEAISFTSVSVPGYSGELRFGLDGNRLTVGVPEPSSWILMALVFLGYCGIRKRGVRR